MALVSKDVDALLGVAEQVAIVGEDEIMVVKLSLIFGKTEATAKLLNKLDR